MRKIFISVMALLAMTLGQLSACTNFIITKGASADGSCMVTYSADSHTLYGELYYTPAADHPAGSFRDVVEWDTGKKLGQIPQIPHTYSVVGNMNEYQLAIGETTYGGRAELEGTPGLIDYGSLIYITLERAKNAREAIKVMSELLEAYGYCSSGESFSIIDPNEAWIFEIIGKGPEMKDAKGKIDHISYLSNDIEADYQYCVNAGYKICTDGIEGIPYFWEKGCKYFKILSPTGEQVEFCQVL